MAKKSTKRVEKKERIARIRSLEEAQEILKKNPYMYLVAFTSKVGVGSTVVCSPRKLELYEAYFMIDRANEEQGEQVLTITNVVELASPKE